MTRVMIAIDGTELDRRVADVARRLFGDTADFWAVNVHDDTIDRARSAAWTGTFPVGFGGAYPVVNPEVYTHREDASDLADEADRRAQDAAESSGLDDARVVAEIGDPAEAIRLAAQRHDVDVIVVGTHERSWWSRLAQPSVSQAVVDDSPVPVLLVTDEA